TVVTWRRRSAASGTSGAGDSRPASASPHCHGSGPRPTAGSAPMATIPGTAPRSSRRSVWQALARAPARPWPLPLPPAGPGRPGEAADTLLGKRSALVDVSSDAGRSICHELLDTADVVLCGYRPGSLDGFGLAPEGLAERHPGIVAVYLAAWGHSGPWAGRRG